MKIFFLAAGFYCIIRVQLRFQKLLDRAGDAAPDTNDKLTIIIDGSLGELIDIIAYNQYFGWYYSVFLAKHLKIGEDVLRPLMLDLMSNMTITAKFDKPLHISEFGAGAKAEHKGGDALIRREDYQAKVYQAQLKMLSNSPQVKGMSPWVLKNFRAMLRSLARVQDFYNRKGLVDENGKRKKAFKVLSEFYSGTWNKANNDNKSDASH